MKILIKIIILIILFPTLSISEVIMSEDFGSDTWSSDWIDQDGYIYCNAANAKGWSSIKTVAGSSYAGDTKSSLEVSTPGRSGVSDRAAKVYYHSNDGENGAFCLQDCSMFMFDDMTGTYCPTVMSGIKDIYIRWYMKIPSNFNLYDSSQTHNTYVKIFRVITTADDGVYVNFNWENAGTFKTGILELCPFSGGWSPIIAISDLNDDAWHCIEIRLEITGGIMQAWVDGVQKLNVSDKEFKDASDTWKSFGLGMGNSSVRDAAVANQIVEPVGSWVALEFDDFVAATEYIGLSNLGSVALTGGTGSITTGGTGSITW